MDRNYAVKRIMFALRERHKGMSVRLQPKPGTVDLEDVYEVHVRPEHAENVKDLDWVLKEVGPLDRIGASNGVFIHDRPNKMQTESVPPRDNDTRRRDVPKRTRRL